MSNTTPSNKGHQESTATASTGGRINDHDDGAPVSSQDQQNRMNHQESVSWSRNIPPSRSPNLSGTATAADPTTLPPSVYSSSKRPADESRTTKSPTRGGGGSTTNTTRSKTRTPPDSSSHPSAPQSFTDQIASSALSGTMELLKLATGVTLSTTGKLYGPSMHVTKTVLAPSLGAALIEYLGQITPKRIQDWFRIVSSSVSHLIDVLITQEGACGQHFRQEFLDWWFCVIESVSSDATQQASIDLMTLLVKGFDALHTPECQAYLKQLAIVGCRVVDVLSSGYTKQLIYQSTNLTWSACQLLADPRTTCALAEVTAYLCHALEMEQSHLQHDRKYRQSNKSPPSSRRRQRNAQQCATYQDHILLQTPNATVEEAILSSLGVPLEYVDGDHDFTDGDDDEDGSGDDGSTIPSKVDHQDTTASHTNRGTTRKADGPPEDGERNEYEQWYHRVKNGVKDDVNVDLLQAKIAQRARQRKREVRKPETTQLSRPPNIIRTSSGNQPLHPDTLQNGQPEESQHPSQNVKTVLKFDEIESDEPMHSREDVEWPQPYHPERLEGETPTDHFYRVLDEILEQQRSSSLKWAVAKADETVKDTTRNGGDASRAKGHVHKAHPNFRDRIAAIRTEIQKEQRERQEKSRHVSRKYRPVVCALLVGVMLLCIAFVGFGMYGMYVFVSPCPVRGWRTVQPDSLMHKTPQSELVIRVVREVIHVDEKGRVLERGDSQSTVTPEGANKLSTCIAEALV